MRPTATATTEDRPRPVTGKFAQDERNATIFCSKIGDVRTPLAGGTHEVGECDCGNPVWVDVELRGGLEKAGKSVNLICVSIRDGDGGCVHFCDDNGNPVLRDN